MSEAVRLLHALSQALSAMSLYSPGHPATRRSSDIVWEAVSALLAVNAQPVFLFLGLTPVYDGRTLHELRDWPWSRRLAEAGIQRLEFDEAVTPESVALLLERILARLTTGQALPAESDASLTGIRFGAVMVESEEATDEPVAPSAVPGSIGVEVDLSDELAAMAFVLAEGARGVVARAETEAIARILGGILDQHQLPQVSHAESGGSYPEAHAVNTALLAMVAGSSWLDRAGRQRIGVVALLHDIGMSRLPAALAAAGSLTESERALMETHTAEGSRLLLESGGRGMELAAIVAYEHHLRPDGTGYPTRRFRPAVHWASRLVGTCAAFDALHSTRPYRPAWSTERAVRYLSEGSGTVFDTEAATLLLGVVSSG